MQKPPERWFDVEDFVPSLKEALEGYAIGPKTMLSVAIPVEESGPEGAEVPIVDDRRVIPVGNDDEVRLWEVESLESLFRGDKKPPHLGDYPVAYNDVFMMLDMHVLDACEVVGDPRDAEMKEIYSLLRRRPDGKSLGFLHDFMWRAAALMLGSRPLSHAEFEAIMSRLERSCRTFQMGPSSRNYAESLRMTLGSGV